jgi:dipeptide/tripeptide permease
MPWLKYRSNTLVGPFKIYAMHPAETGDLLVLELQDRPDQMKAFLRETFFICCMVIAAVSEIAAATIGVAIVTNKLPDSQAWMAAVFFVAVGIAAWILGRAARH